MIIASKSKEIGLLNVVGSIITVVTLLIHNFDESVKSNNIAHAGKVVDNEHDKMCAELIDEKIKQEEQSRNKPQL